MLVENQITIIIPTDIIMYIFQLFGDYYIISLISKQYKNFIENIYIEKLYDDMIIGNVKENNKICLFTKYIDISIMKSKFENQKYKYLLSDYDQSCLESDQFNNICMLQDYCEIKKLLSKELINHIKNVQIIHSEFEDSAIDVIYLMDSSMEMSKTLAESIISAMEYILYKLKHIPDEIFNIFLDRKYLYPNRFWGEIVDISSRSNSIVLIKTLAICDINDILKKKNPFMSDFCIYRHYTASFKRWYPIIHNECESHVEYKYIKICVTNYYTKIKDLLQEITSKFGTDITLNKIIHKYANDVLCHKCSQKVMLIIEKLYQLVFTISIV